MNDHQEEIEILKIGKEAFDVSNITYERKSKAIRIWNDTISKSDVTVEKINQMCREVGLILIRQDFDTLKQRMTTGKALKSYIKRLLLTEKDLKKQSLKGYEDFEDFVYFTLTGDKKKDLETDQKVMKLTREIFLRMEKEMNLNQEQCLELLMTSVKEQAKRLQTYTKGQKVSL